MKARVLVVDDDRLLRDAVSYSLQRDGYETLLARSGEEALSQVRDGVPDLVLLDIGLPGMDGIEVCKELRRQGSVPVIFLSARDEDVDRILGLEMGADDYVTKPFNMTELMARVKAVLRRTRPPEAPPGQRPHVDAGPVSVDPLAHVASVGERSLELSPREFDLLYTLAAHPNQVLTRDRLLDEVWGVNYVGDVKTLDVHIRWLRQKLETDPQNPQLIQTVRGIGYKLVV